MMLCELFSPDATAEMWQQSVEAMLPNDHARVVF